MAQKAKATMNRNEIAAQAREGLHSIGIEAMIAVDKDVGYKGSICDMANDMDRKGILQGFEAPEKYHTEESGESEGQDVTYHYAKFDDLTIVELIRHNFELLRKAVEIAMEMYDIPAFVAFEVVGQMVFMYAKGWVAERSLARYCDDFSKGGRNQDKGGIDGWMNGEPVQVKSWSFEGSHKYKLVYYAFDDDGSIHFGTGKREADVLKAAVKASSCNTSTAYKMQNYLED